MSAIHPDHAHSTSARWQNEMAFELAEKEPRKRTGASAEPLNKQKFLQPPGGQRHPKVNDKIMSEPPNKTRGDDPRRLPSVLRGTAAREQSRSSRTQRSAPSNPPTGRESRVSATAAVYGGRSEVDIRSMRPVGSARYTNANTSRFDDISARCRCEAVFDLAKRIQERAAGDRARANDTSNDIVVKQRERNNRLPLVLFAHRLFGVSMLRRTNGRHFRLELVRYLSRSLLPEAVLNANEKNPQLHNKSTYKSTPWRWQRGEPRP